MGLSSRKVMRSGNGVGKVIWVLLMRLLCLEEGKRSQEVVFMHLLQKR